MNVFADDTTNTCKMSNITSKYSSYCNSSDLLRSKNLILDTPLYKIPKFNLIFWNENFGET